jgi:hypothetical protein
MNSRPETAQDSAHFDGHDDKHQQKALHNFKKILRDLVFMFREASHVETVYIYWVNRARRQFVLETKTTVFSKVVFQDRIGFEQHFLNEFKNLEKPVTLVLGEDINPKALAHYPDKAPVAYITLLPVVKNGETIALTAVESSKALRNKEQGPVFQTFMDALANLIDVFLEISDLYEDQQKWIAYEEQLHFLQNHGPYASLMKSMLNTMQKWVNRGGVSLVCRAMGTWVNVLNAEKSEQPLAIGTQLDGPSVTRDAMNEKAPEFAVHFNQKPNRLAVRENRADGATLAIPLIYRGKTMGIALVYDDNPLLFKDSVKHKFINTARLTALNIPSRLQDHPGSLFIHSSDAIIPDIWERTIDTEIQRLRDGTASCYTWVSLINLSELSNLRTQLQMEDLNLMQKDLVHAFNPGKVDIPGFIGFCSDYRYMSLIQSQDPEAQNFWAGQIRETFSAPFRLSNGRQIRTGIQINTLELNEQYNDSYEVMTQLKKNVKF